MLHDYLARIGLPDRPGPDAAGLERIQRAHRMAIGFENIDVMLGRPIRTDPEAIWAKLGGRRGGYCFEHNALFGAMLGELGLPNRPLLARVWLGAEWPGDPAALPPRTHTLRLVTVGADRWIADAGFGGSYVPPLPLADGAGADSHDGASHRLVRVGETGKARGAWLLERRGAHTATDGRAHACEDWQPQYSFDLAEVAQADLDLSNWWTSARPGTRFTTGCRASIVLADGFAALNDRRLAIHRGDAGTAREIATPEEWQAVMRDLFHVALSADEVARLGLF